MSQHSSFGKGSSTNKTRSVLKRYEKVEALQKKEIWSPEKGVLGLPKVKVMRIKAKKEKTAKAEAGKEGAAGAAAPAKAAEAKPAAKPAAKSDKK